MTDVNKTCACKTLNTELLQKQLAKSPLLEGLIPNLSQSHPHLFSSTTFFLSEVQLNEIKTIIGAVEAVIQNPDYRQHVLMTHPAPITKGVFMGYDFHLGETGPKIIEINTNAGGALLNAELARAQKVCCAEVLVDAKIEEAFVSMFEKEYALATSGTLRTIAIIDEDPESQYLYPEFLLFKALFEKRGYTVFIADPLDLKVQDGAVYVGEQRIDLIYNRLTDFSFSRHTSLRDIQSTIITPAPAHHALYARKDNLVLLSDSSFLDSLKLNQSIKVTLLNGVPKTEILTPEKKDYFWENRKFFFFKPFSGHGSKAAYRGDKITKKVWEEILKEKYVAQALIPPSSRLVDVDGTPTELKADVRVYTYDGEILHIAARLYSGQTTNFRTQGGGFAPVAILRDS